MIDKRYSTAGLAHSAADRITEETGEKHEMKQIPPRLGQPWEYGVVKADAPPTPSAGEAK